MSRWRNAIPADFREKLLVSTDKHKSRMEVDENLKAISSKSSVECLGQELPTKKRKLDDSTCSICLREYVDPSIIRACEHIFCFTCISKWLAHKPCCPLCKHRVDEIKHKFTRSRTFEPEWSDRGEIVSARQIIEAGEFTRLSEHTWLLESELELIDEAVSKIEALMYLPKPDTIKQALELRTNLKALRHGSSNYKRLDLIRHPLFRFVIYYMDADRHTLITTHTDINLDEQYVRANRQYLRSELVPFVAREVNAITGLEAINIQKLMDMLLDAFENPNQKRENLFVYLKSIGVDHPRTLYKHIQEFATADQSLLLYDSNSRYKIRAGLGPSFTDDNAEVQVISAPDHDDIQYIGVSRVARLDPNPKMAAKKIVSTFVNRNPRNTEFLNLKPRPTGWAFEKDRDQRNFLYKVVLHTSKNSTEGLLIHHEDGVVLRASTREPSIGKQLHSVIDTSAAMNIGRVLAKRCIDSGITNCITGATADEIERSKRKSAFFKTLQENGISLVEKEPIKHSFINDPNYTWSDMTIQDNRQNKLDELDLKMP